MNIIKRYGAPNKMDQCPKGTICVVQCTSTLEKKYWEQISNDQDNPSWQEMSEDEIEGIIHDLMNYMLPR